MKVSGASSAKLLNLNEEVVGDVEFRDSTAFLNVGPRKIVTLGFDLQPRRCATARVVA